MPLTVAFHQIPFDKKYKHKMKVYKSCEYNFHKKTAAHKMLLNLTSGLNFINICLRDKDERSFFRAQCLANGTQIWQTEEKFSM